MCRIYSGPTSSGHESALQEHLSCGQLSGQSAADRSSGSISPLPCLPASWAQPLGPAQCCLLAGLLPAALHTVGPWASSLASVASAQPSYHGSHSLEVPETHRLLIRCSGPSSGWFCLLILPLRITMPSFQEQMMPCWPDPSSLPITRGLQLLPTGKGSSLFYDFGLRHRNYMVCEGVCRQETSWGWTPGCVWTVSLGHRCCREKGIPSVYTQAGRMRHGQDRPRPTCSLEPPQKSPAKISRCMRNEHLSVMTANTLGLFVMMQ